MLGDLYIGNCCSHPTEVEWTPYPEFDVDVKTKGAPRELENVHDSHNEAPCGRQVRLPSRSGNAVSSEKRHLDFCGGCAVGPG